MIPAVIQSIESNEERAFLEQLFQENYPIIKRTVVFYNRNVSLTEDLIQDTALRLVRNAGKLHDLPEKARITYIYYTARSAALNRLDKDSRRARHETDGDGLLMELREASPGPEELTEQKETHDEMNSLLARLPEMDRILLQCRYYLTLKDREIAELTGIRLNNVRGCVQSARKKALRLVQEQAAKRLGVRHE